VFKLSQAKSGQKYIIESLDVLKSMSRRLAILGLNAGVIIEIIALHKHGAVIKTPFGDIALDSNYMDSVLVSLA
jgi:Fe2+ transport system protein FeoA